MAKLLVADDDRVMRLTLCEGLRAASFEVIEAGNGIQALELCMSETPALALLDIRMPGMDGLALARRLHDESRVPFMFFSAYCDEEYMRRAAEIGGLGFLVKPISVAEIVPMIYTALARSKDISGLIGALAKDHLIAVAVGMLMSSAGIDQTAAFEQLREKARS